MHNKGWHTWEMANKSWLHNLAFEYVEAPEQPPTSFGLVICPIVTILDYRFIKTEAR